jgi:NAD(P)-dependent dehydrogenase (short-subunit alcohol dehydrogenase family)
VHQSLTDHVIVVTGGSGLIGSQFIRAIADCGAVAVIADIDEARAEQVQHALQEEKGSRKIAFLKMDITSSESIDETISTLLARYGRVDGLVNNAYPRTPHYGRKLEEVTYEDFTANLGMHVGGYFLTSQRFLVPFRASGRGGSIINMGSIYGVVAPRFDVYAGTSMTMPVEYAAIKAAIIHMTRYFAQYTKGQGIRVNCISPGGVLDGQSPAFVEAYRAHAGEKGMLSPSDLEGALLFLLGDASRYINGQNIVVDDGWSL